MSNVTPLPLHSNSRLPAREDRDWVTSIELIDDAGISYRQLDYWTRTGLLTPLEDEAGRGSGHLRRFDLTQLTKAQTLRDLLAAGVSLVTCRAVIDDLLNTGHVTLGAITLTHQPNGGHVA